MIAEFCGEFEEMFHAVPKTQTFISIITRYMKCSDDGYVDVSGVFSRQCYEHCLFMCHNETQNPEECFRKSILRYVSGKGTHFSPVVENAILDYIRQNKVWDCFDGYFYNDDPSKPIKIGKRGCKVFGYHEKKRLGLTS